MATFGDAASSVGGDDYKKGIPNRIRLTALMLLEKPLPPPNSVQAHIDQKKAHRMAECVRRIDQDQQKLEEVECTLDTTLLKNKRWSFLGDRERGCRVHR